MKHIEKVAGVLIDDINNLLCVKKKGLDAWISPGGKIEPGENHEQCLRRELREELNVTLGFTIPDLAREKPLLTCRGIAEGTTDVHLTIHFYEVYLAIRHRMEPCREIEYYVWAPIAIYDRLPLAWTMKNELCPLLLKK